MTGPFYGVLGVGPDADEGEIRRAYRQRVKDHHPDVSADPDASERFKRLTTARETLTDRTERARYDRLGHEAYVAAHVDSSVWDGVAEPDADRDSDASDDGADQARETVEWSADTAATAETTSTAGSRSTDPPTDGSQAGATASAATTGRPDRSGARSTARRERGGTASTSTGPTGGGSAGSYARSSFWNAHDPGQTYGAGADRDPLVRRLRSVVTALGPWLLVHAVFLALAFGTCWYALTTLVADPASSPSLVFAMLGEAGLAVVLTGLHAISRIYR